MNFSVVSDGSVVFTKFKRRDTRVAPYVSYKKNGAIRHRLLSCIAFRRVLFHNYLYKSGHL